MLTFEEMGQLFVKIEVTLNYRPLTYVDAEGIDQPLTPVDLIYGQKLPHHLVIINST